MSDIVEKCQCWLCANEKAAQAAEIERLRAGGCARDQGTTQYCAEAARLAAENERLRAALRGAEGQMAMGNMNGGWRILRAALEEGRI